METKPKLSYADTVYLFLDRLEPGARVLLDYSKPHTYRFIEIAKEYMSLHAYANGLSFNEDFTVLKKQKF